MVRAEDASPSATVPDWSRETKRPFAWDPPRALLASIRSYQRHGKSRWPWHFLLQKLAILRHRFWSIATGAHIPVNSRIRGGLQIPHPNGIVIHPESEIGPNCMIMQQVTIGVATGSSAPRLGGNVLVGCGAKVLGGIRIGDNARIGANAVVLQDVPAGATAVGVPARILGSRGAVFLAALLVAYVHTASAVTPANANSPLGMNLNGVAYYSTEQPFMNVFVTNGGWITRGENTWDTHEEQYLQLDANGYPKTLAAAPSDPHSPQLFDSVAVVLDRVPAPFLFPAGRYVVLYDGEGTLTYGIDARLVSSSRGRDVINVVPTDTDGIYVQITATDPRHNGNYIRNIRVVSEQNLGAFEAGQLFDPTFLQMLARFRVLRFMEWLDTNDSTVASWSDRPGPGYYSWTNGVPLEAIVKLANAESADPWINVPTMANDDFVQRMAALVHAGLGHTQKVYVEYSNEVWNNAFPQYRYAVNRGEQLWPDRPSGDNGYEWNRNWYGMHSAHVCEIWKSTWGADSGRVICVLGAQAGYSYSAKEALDCPYWTAAPCSKHGFDAVAIAPYFGDRDLPADWAAAPDGGLSLLFASLTPPNGSWVKNVAADETSYATLAAQYHLRLVAYEGGQGFIGGSAGPAGRLFLAANRDPRMGTAYSDYLRQWKANGGQLFVLFNDIGSYGQYGEWGALESLMQLKQRGAQPPPKWAAIQGFISDTQCWWPQCSK